LITLIRLLVAALIVMAMVVFVHFSSRLQSPTVRAPS
jgi:hypothetical protein